MTSPTRHGPNDGDDGHGATALQPGVEAPAFALHATPDQVLQLADLRGHPVILAFYPADFSPVCGDQMVLYNEILPEFRRHGAELVGISVDGVWCHRAFADARKLHFPLLADFEPKGAVARSYGVYRGQEGTSERALFVIDADLVAYVEQLGLDARRVAREIDSEAYQPRVRADFMSGVRSGVNGTPTFFINGERYDDAWDAGTLLSALTAAAGDRAAHSRA